MPVGLELFVDSWGFALNQIRLSAFWGNGDLIWAHPALPDRVLSSSVPLADRALESAPPKSELQSEVVVGGQTRVSSRGPHGESASELQRNSGCE